MNNIGGFFGEFLRHANFHSQISRIWFQKNMEHLILSRSEMLRGSPKGRLLPFPAAQGFALGQAGRFDGATKCPSKGLQQLIARLI